VVSLLGSVLAFHSDLLICRVLCRQAYQTTLNSAPSTLRYERWDCKLFVAVDVYPVSKFHFVHCESRTRKPNYPVRQDRKEPANHIS
jgi:hypothetical protein